MKYTIFLSSRKVEKQFYTLPKNIKDKITEKILSLESNPHPWGSVQLVKNVFRIRIGNYRIIYEVFNNERKIVITKIVKRDEKTYKGI